MSLKAAASGQRPWLSLLGAALAALYLAAFIVLYVTYLQNAGTFLADLPLLLSALPFTLMMNALTNGAFSMTGDETGKVILAALFCCALAYIVGAVVEWILRAAWRIARNALLPRETGEADHAKHGGGGRA